MTTAEATTAAIAGPGTAPSKRLVVVAGDVIWDHHLYRGERLKPGDPDRRGTHAHRETGGAILLHRLIAEVLPPAQWETHCAVAPPDPDAHVAMALWGPYPRAKKNDTEHIWRVAELLGYGGAASAAKPMLATAGKRSAVATPDLIVLDDAGSKFRLLQQRPCWSLPDPKGPGADQNWVLLKMSDPVARGDLWHALVGSGQCKRLVCLMSAQDLRRESVSLRQGVSWEQTVSEIHAGLREHPVLVHLRSCRHLVIVFSADGALWIDHDTNGTKATLVFDPGGFDGHSHAPDNGRVVGMMMAMTSAVTAGIARHIVKSSGDVEPLDLVAALKDGLGAMRRLQLRVCLRSFAALA